MKQQSFIFVGRYGAGKGTQANLLIEALKKSGEKDIIHIETGAEFRKIAEAKTFTGDKVRYIIDNGFLMPIFMCVYIWGDVLVQKFTGAQHLIFDGTPRKLMEAKMLEDVFPYYGIDKPWVIYLDVHHEESIKRLSLRATSKGRKDDSDEAIVRRRAAYEEDVIPSIEWYRTSPNVRFLDVDGVRSIEEIHADIVKRVGLQ